MKNSQKYAQKKVYAIKFFIWKDKMYSLIKNDKYLKKNYINTIQI